MDSCDVQDPGSDPDCTASIALSDRLSMVIQVGGILPFVDGVWATRGKKAVRLCNMH